MNILERVIWVFYGWRVINGGYYVKFDDYCVIFVILFGIMFLIFWCRNKLGVV